MAKLSLDEFLEQLRTIPYFQPDGDPEPEWILVLGKTWGTARGAAADAAKSAAKIKQAGSSAAAWDAARTAAWNAAKIAVSDAERETDWAKAWDAARDATREAAWAAARSQAPDTAWAGPWDAAWHAGDYAAICIVCGDLFLPEEHLQTIERRLDVWRKGYALMAEVAGTLYVYAAHTPPR